jgi:hypothetical protein
MIAWKKSNSRDRCRFWLSYLALWFYFCSQNFQLFCFPIFWFWAYLMKVILRSSDFERTWWRLFSDLLILSVPDEGYSPIFWFWACLMKVILRSSDFERTWWRLFQKLVVRTKLDIYASIQGCHYNMYIFSYD